MRVLLSRKNKINQLMLCKNLSTFYVFSDNKCTLIMCPKGLRAHNRKTLI